MPRAISWNPARTLATPDSSSVETRATGRGVMAQVINLYRGPLFSIESTLISRNGLEAANSSAPG